MKQKGFTLVETLLAMVILASAMVLLTTSWGGSYARIRKTQLKTEVIALLERKMVEIDTEYKGKPLDSIPEEKEDDFGSDYPQYRWKLKSKEFEFPDLGPMLTAKADGANQMLLMIMKQLSEHLKKTVKEVKVSVLYKPPKGDELEYSITTYYVDYDKQISLPGMPGGG
jgi:general secretion pathway protein I